MTRTEWGFTILFTLLFAVISAIVSGHLTLQARTQSFQSDAQRIQASLLESLESARGLSVAMGTLYRTHEHIDSSSFSFIATDILDANTALSTITYSPWLEAGRKEAFVTAQRDEGFPTFSIQTQKDSDAQTYFLPLQFIEPFDPLSARFMGEDLFGRKEIQQDIIQSIESNESRLVLFNSLMDHDNQLALIHPVYSGMALPSSKDMRLLHARGLLLFTFSIDQWAQGQNLTPDTKLSLNYCEDEDAELTLTTMENSGSSESSLLRLNESLDVPTFPIRIHMEKGLGFSELSRSPVPLAVIVATVLGLIFSQLIISRRRIKLNEQATTLELQNMRRHAETTLQSIGDGVITVDSYLIIRSVNSTAEKLLCKTSEELVGSPANSVIKLIDEKSGKPLGLFSSREHDISRNHIILSRSGNTELPVEIDIRNLHGNHEEDMGQVIVLRDVSTERELSRELRYQATHDLLTGLMNRYAFDQELQAALKSSHRNGSHHVLCYLDLDQFKLINDTCGHMAGDEVLKQVTSVIHNQLRSQDMFARLGGDEFGILLSNCPLDKAQEIAERIRCSIHDFRFPWEEKVFDLRVSIGLVPITDNAESMTELLSAADVACYTAKDRGRDQIYTYQSDDESISERHGQMQWLPILQDALRENHFTLNLQPILPISSNKLPRIYEFLIRLNHPDNTPSLPGSFLPAAERYDLMREIDTWVIYHCFELIHSYRLPDNVCFSINLSGQSLTDPMLVTRILQANEAYPVDPSRIYFEITETSAITSLAATTELINRLRALDYRFALDDFGSGFSSYSYLSKLPVDLLKIDGQFVRDINENKIHHTLVKGIREIAEVLNVATIAEFVESQEIVESIDKLGIEYMQGYHCGRPDSAKTILENISVTE
jgi:diguanylate cyclase (GGDEF)-like protein/PAS domain S-box-containing protein